MQKKLTEKQIKKLIKAAEVINEVANEPYIATTLDAMIVNGTSDGNPLVITSSEQQYRDTIREFLRSSSWDHYKHQNIKSIEIHLRDTESIIQCGVQPFIKLEQALQDN